MGLTLRKMHHYLLTIVFDEMAVGCKELRTKKHLTGLLKVFQYLPPPRYTDLFGP